MELEETQNLMETVKELSCFSGAALPHRVKSKNTSIKIQNCSYDRLRMSEAVME